MGRFLFPRGIFRSRCQGQLDGPFLAGRWLERVLQKRMGSGGIGIAKIQCNPVSPWLGRVRPASTLWMSFIIISASTLEYGGKIIVS